MTCGHHATNRDALARMLRGSHGGIGGIPLSMQESALGWVDSLIAQAENADRAVAEARNQPKACGDVVVPPERMGDFGSWELLEHVEVIDTVGIQLMIGIPRAGNGRPWSRLSKKGLAGGELGTGEFDRMDLPEFRAAALAWAREHLLKMAAQIGADLGKAGER